MTCLADEGRLPNGKSQSHLREYMREIILSYRLLFGDDGAARQVFKNTEKKRAKHIMGFRDPLLDDLCRLKDAKTEGFAESVSRGKSSYSTEADFPIFAPRWLLLQQFVCDQKPQRVWDLWKDKTDMQKWSGLWVASILAAVALFLALVQIILSALQVYYAAKSSRNR